MSKFGPSLVAELPQQTGNENLVSHVLFVFILNFAWILNFQWLLFFTLKHRSIYKRENSQLSHQWLRGYALPTLRKHNSPSILRKWIFLLETVTLKRKLISGKNISRLYEQKFLWRNSHSFLVHFKDLCVCWGGVCKWVQELGPSGAGVTGSCELSGVGDGIECRSFGKVVHVLNHWAISPDLSLFVLKIKDTFYLLKAWQF